jgi:hypothetical protein
MLKRLLTKNLTQIPLLWVDFNYQSYKEKGKSNSCIIHLHPVLTHDEYIKKTLNELVDYIRNNFDMEGM